MPRLSLRIVLFVLACGLAGVAALWVARRIPVGTPPAPDYDLVSAWLCRPGRADVCASPTTATVFAPDGTHHGETYKPDPAAPIDCFYVYPTVSRVRAAYAPIGATDEERDAARDQLARFGAVCRPFAPLYRQVTLAGLPLLFGGKRGVTIDVPYADVLAAWQSYLAKDNHGRGFVLIGHSQGARLLARLVAEEIDGKPIAARLVSAIVPGTRVDVPDGRRVGGLFRKTPLCTSATQTDCVIAYSSYPADRKMPADARFGVSSTPGQRFACVDPAALVGATTLDADLPMRGEIRATYGTDFAEVPGLVSARCVDDGPFSSLALSVDPAGPVGARTKALFDRLASDNPAFGLHVLDINAALGTLVEVVRRQTRAYAHP